MCYRFEKPTEERDKSQNESAKMKYNNFLLNSKI